MIDPTGHVSGPVTNDPLIEHLGSSEYLMANPSAYFTLLQPASFWLANFRKGFGSLDNPAVYDYAQYMSQVYSTGYGSSTYIDDLNMENGDIWGIRAMYATAYNDGNNYMAWWTDWDTGLGNENNRFNFAIDFFENLYKVKVLGLSFISDFLTQLGRDSDAMGPPLRLDHRLTRALVVAIEGQASAGVASGVAAIMDCEGPVGFVLSFGGYISISKEMSDFWDVMNHDFIFPGLTEMFEY